MTVLVTGGAGYIGSHVVWDLVDRGEKVVVLDDLTTGFAEAVPPGVKLVKGDVGDGALVRSIIADHGVDAVAHFAAKVVVPDSVADPLGYYLANTVKSRALIEAAVKSAVERFIFSSTAAVYGSPAQERVTETTPPEPVSPYGRSKLMTEWMLQDAARATGLRYVILRYFNVAGADPLGRTGQSTPRATHLVKVACEAALGRRSSLEIYGTDFPTPDGSCLRDYIHVADLARAHLLALDHLAAGGANLTLNCGYGRGYSVLEVVDAVKRISGADFPVRFAARRPGDPARVIATGERVRAELGWTPRFGDLDSIVSHALAWERRIGPAARLARAQAGGGA
ncbi:UDP-glucose 4-epimerase GalE [Alsobacter sp. SYSU M60028]|uniref:UDP-glucose 4-epimerase n=1 Tax=Alsobacter ponti TaxID=2962936 RepID=A0ABT1LAC5_9HYPH|nr:UDP-glucose 4-epimerase GalE [Alsobacter ponti]MCP8938430.1 UDP-glucose 4-epimerase GalE [Alsobacter ponti]